MADEELQGEEGGKKKSKLMLIIIIVVVLLAGGGGAAYFFLFMGDEEVAEQSEDGAASEAETALPAEGIAIYVAMPRPFVSLTRPAAGRETELVQIEVQLMVRGTENEASANMTYSNDRRRLYCTCI